MPEIICADRRPYSFDIETTALICIDMQRDFLHEQGMAGYLGTNIDHVQAIIPAAKRLVTAARNAGLTVIHTREGYAPDLSDMHPAKQARDQSAETGPMGRFLIRGEYGHDFHDGFEPRLGELVIDKPGFGAFYRTELEEKLAKAGITHLILFGVTTQCCVQSTLREAVDRGFYCLTLEDCCAAYEEHLHNATFDTIRGEANLFGWIGNSDDLCEELASTPKDN